MFSYNNYRIKEGDEQNKILKTQKNKMTNKLISKLGLGALTLALAGGLNGCKKYNIDGNEIIKPDVFVNWKLKEIKSSGEEIFYFEDVVKICYPGFWGREKFYDNSTNFYLEAQKRMKYLNHKIDSIEDVKELNDLKLLKK